MRSRGARNSRDPAMRLATSSASDVAFRELGPSEEEPPGESRYWSLNGLARIVRLEAGLHVITIGTCAAAADVLTGVSLPTTCVSPGPPGDGEPVRIFPTMGNAPGWLAAEGGSIVAQAPPGGGVVVLTTYGVGDPAQLPQLEIVRLDGPAVAPINPPAPAARPDPVSESAGMGLQSEIILHVERQGDRQLPGGGWVGNRGQRSRIEAFGIRPLETLTPGDVKYMAFGPGGRQTPWVTDARLCGTRGRGLPLTGFAISLLPAVADRFDVVYEGSFFDSGAVGPKQNGEPCLPPIADDPLEAMRVRLIQRSSE
jgi:hypothetical protein